MNEKNNRLDADVQDFNRRVMEKRRTGTSAILKPTDKELEKTKKMAKTTTGKKKGLRRRKKRSSFHDDSSDESESSSDLDDNVF